MLFTFPDGHKRGILHSEQSKVILKKIVVHSPCDGTLYREQVYCFFFVLIPFFFFRMLMLRHEEQLQYILLS